MSPEAIQVLLVEDNRGDARLVRELVREAGPDLVEFDHVEKLEEAERRLRVVHFDLVLLDLSLPDSEGLDTVIRAREQARSTPIVVLTGLADEQMAIDALQAGAQDYLVKGRMDGHSTLRAIRYAIERARRERAEVLQKTRTTQLWKSMFRILGPGAPAVLYRAGFDAGSNMFDFVMETWKPPDEDSLVRAVREHLHSAGVCDLRDLRLERQTQRAIAVIHDSFETGQYGPTASTPVCHFLRGLLSGLVNRITEIPDVVCDELKCQAKGDAECEFAVHRMLS
jgi:CheY-like chemotaxis protein